MFKKKLLEYDKEVTIDKIKTYTLNLGNTLIKYEPEQTYTMSDMVPDNFVIVLPTTDKIGDRTDIVLNRDYNTFKIIKKNNAFCKFKINNIRFEEFEYSFINNTKTLVIVEKISDDTYLITI